MKASLIFSTGALKKEKATQEFNKETKLKGKKRISFERRKV